MKDDHRLPAPYPAKSEHGIDPPPIRRGPEATSGTPSGMMA